MIKIYGNETCSFCLRAKRLASTYDYEYEWLDTDEEEIAKELRALVPNYKTIPQIFADGKYIGGFTEFSAYVDNCSGGSGEVKS